MAYLDDSECFAENDAIALVGRVADLPRRATKSQRIGWITVTAAVLALSCCGLSEAQEPVSARLDRGAAITTDRTPVTSAGGESTEVTLPENTSVVPFLVVTTNANNPANAANCSPQAAPNAGTDAACGLADALAYATNSGGASISFSSAVFNASNTVAENTIPVPDNPSTHYLGEPFLVPSNTTITGPVATSGGVTTNLITIVGWVASNISEGSVEIQINQGVSGSSITNLNLTGGDGAIINDGNNILVNHCVINKNTNTTNGNGGGIVNAGSMVLKNSSITGNQSTFSSNQYGNFFGGVGGGIFNSGTLTILASTISGNSDTYNNAAGGGIYNSGVLTVINSTITGNSAYGVDGSLAPPIGVVLTAKGGGIASAGSGATLTVFNSTITGNTASVGKENGISAGPGTGGGGIYGVATVRNSIVSGNTASEGANDIQGDLIDKGGNLVGASGLNLAPLGNYGGLTETMIPLPGSPAICYGLVANDTISGVTLDQRGVPRTTGYIDSGTAVTCVDSGAVESDYLLRFTTQPPAVAAVGVPMKPAPVVDLTESGRLVTYYNGVVDLMDIPHSLTDPAQATLGNGFATFSDAVMFAAVTNDTITARLEVGSTAEIPALFITADSSVKVSVAAAPAVLVSPTPGSTLTSGTVTFRWTESNVAGTQYGLIVGTEGQGSSNIYKSGALDGTSITLTVPTTGGTLWVGLTQGATGPWLYTPYTYKEAAAAAATAAGSGSQER